MAESPGPHAARVAGRRARARNAQALAATGLDARAIATRLAVSRFTVYSYLRDPPNEQNRRLKESYRGECARCGTATSGGDGPGHARPHCPTCAAKTRVWSPEQIVQALCDWRERSGTGRLPSSYELERSVIGRQSDWRAALLEHHRYPSPRSCRRRFGSYQAALAAADRRTTPARPDDLPALSKR